MVPVSDKRLIFIGAGGHATSVLETALASGYVIEGLVSPKLNQDIDVPYPIFEAVPVGYLESGGLLSIAVGDNFLREQVWQGLKDQGAKIEQFPTLIHPSASVAKNAIIAPAVCVLQGAVIGSRATLAFGSLANSGSIIEHECVIDEFSSIGPGAVLGGKVHVGTRTAISIGAVVKHGVVVGSDSVVGAGSYVHNDIGSEVVAYGSPARRIRDRRTGERYL